MDFTSFPTVVSDPVAPGSVDRKTPPGSGPGPFGSPFGSMDSYGLLGIIQELSYKRDIPGIMEVVKRAARRLVRADGVTFVLREGDKVFYADEDAISPLWKGQRFPASACISGWAIIHKQAVAIEDIYQDPRIPHDAYRRTFVRSLAMVPVREENPVAAIGAYWATRRQPTPHEMELLKALAGTTSVALTNAELFAAANQAIQVRDEFLSIASHELKTPLTVLQLQMELFRSALKREANGDLPEVQETYFSKFFKQLSRLNALVGDLLDVSRIQAGKLELTLEQVNPSKLVEEVLEKMAAHLSAAGCPVNLELRANRLGNWDHTRIEQVLLNLLSNIIKYAPGAPVTIRTATDETTAWFVIQDAGPGIAKDHQKIIFERFERGVPVKGTSGLGLGLYLVRKMIESHHGKISLESDLGRGATFTLELPLQPFPPKQGAAIR